MKIWEKKSENIFLIEKESNIIFIDKKGKINKYKFNNVYLFGLFCIILMCNWLVWNEKNLKSYELFICYFLLPVVKKAWT